MGTGSMRVSSFEDWQRLENLKRDIRKHLLGRRGKWYMGTVGSNCHFPVLCLLAFEDTALKS